MLFTRLSLLIWQAAFILFLSSVSSFMPMLGIEVNCWAQAPSYDQKTDQIDVKSEQQTHSPSLESDPSMGQPPQPAVPRAPQPLQSPIIPPDMGQSPIGQPSLPVVQPPAAVQSSAIPLPRRGQITLNFDDADVYSVIQTIFGEALRVNYVVDSRVTGRVTFRAVAPIPMEKVLPLMEVILKLSGIGVFEDNGLYRIVPIGDIPKGPSQVFVYQVQNGKAKDIASLLQQIFLGSKPATSERTSTLTKIGSAPTPSSSAMSSQSPVSTISTGGEAVITDFMRIIPDEITNTIIVMSSPEDYATIKKTIEKIDIVQRQVVVEGMVAAVSLTDNLSLGISALFTGEIFGLDAKFGLNLSGLTPKDGVPGTGFTFVGVDSSGTVRSVINALATESKAKVLAAPHILVSDNREARIQVGQQVPLITSETYGTDGDNIRNFQYRDIGIILKVKPRVNEGGLVSLEIYQEISTYEKLELGVADEQILLNKTDVTTELVVQNGQTIVIGGLIREDTTKGVTGIPFLSKIPIIGFLFGDTSKETKRQELIVLLTPHVIKNQKDAKDISSDFIDNMSDSSQGRIKKEELLKEKQQKQEGVKPPAN